jgi:MFS superfamily sulfate permease-like transporter
LSREWRSSGLSPQGLPELGIPVFSPGDVELVFPLALGFLGLSFVVLSTIARTYAKEHEYEIDNNQELLALGASSISVGICQVSGNFLTWILSGKEEYVPECWGISLCTTYEIRKTEPYEK